MERRGRHRPRACDAVGRDPATLELTGWGRLVLEADGTALARDGCLAGSPAEVAATVRAVSPRPACAT